MTETAEYTIVLRYHVPRSQVWEGARGSQRGHVHLHVKNGPTHFTGPNGRTISRGGGRALCLHFSPRAFMANKYAPNGIRYVGGDEETAADLCPRCLYFAERYGVEVPELPTACGRSQRS